MIRLKAELWRKRIRKPVRLAFRALERCGVFSPGPWARCWLTLAPLAAVILLCWIMVGWREKLRAASLPTVSPEAGMMAQPAKAPLAGGAMAAFERLRISHANVNVPE